jgi:hypothetical protein
MPQLRSGKEAILRSPAHSLRSSAPPRQPTPPIQSTPSGFALIHKQTPGIDRAPFVTPELSLQTAATGALELLADPAGNAKVANAGSIRRSYSGSPNKQHSPSVFDIDALNVETVTFEDIPEALGRGNRSKKPTLKAPTKLVVDERMSRASRPSKTKSTDKSSNEAFLNAMIHKQNAPKRAERAAYWQREAENIVGRALPVEVTPPPIALAFMHLTMVAAVHDGLIKEPFISRPIRDAWKFKFEDWRESVLDSKSLSSPNEAVELFSERALAVISSNSRAFKPNTFTVECDDTWNEVVFELQQWETMGCKQARVDLKLRVRSVRTQIQDPYTTTRTDEDNDIEFVSARRLETLGTSHGVLLAAKKAGGKASVSEARLLKESDQRKADAAAKFHCTKIIESNTCKTKTCATSGLPCIIIHGEHIRVTLPQLAAWSDAINRFQASITVPHPQLMEKLTEQANRRLEEREGKSKNKKKTNQRDSSSEDDRKGRRKRSKHDEQPRSGHDSTIGQMMNLLVMDRLSSITNATAKPSKQPYQDGASSPIRIPDSKPVLLSDYLVYLILQEPAKQERWEATGKILDDNDITFKLLQTFEAEGLTKIGVTIGHAKVLLGRDMNQFLRSI